MTPLQRPHAELRAALMLAGKELRKLIFGGSDTPLLRKLCAVLRMRGKWRGRKAARSDEA